MFDGRSISLLLFSPFECNLKCINTRTKLTTFSSSYKKTDFLFRWADCVVASSTLSLMTPIKITDFPLPHQQGGTDLRQLFAILHCDINYSHARLVKYGSSNNAFICSIHFFCLSPPQEEDEELD